MGSDLFADHVPSKLEPMGSTGNVRRALTRVTCVTIWFRCRRTTGLGKAMAQEEDEEELKRLCELADNEIITLLDAKHAKLCALPQPDK